MPLTNYTFQQLIDFTRTTAATFVGSNGLIQTTPQSRNLLTFTEEFDNAAWSKNNTTVTANTTVAPDGTSTADLVISNTTGGVAHNIYSSVTISAATHSLSFYAKQGGYTGVRVADAATGTGANFDLANGVVFGTPSAGFTASIQSAGNGWYRCSITFTATAGANLYGVYIQQTPGTTVYAGDGTSGIFLWGAQLETGSTATDYTRNVGGLFPARFDYDPVTLAPRGILIEEQRTNLLLRSEEFDNAAWTKSNSTVTTNAVVAPDGASTGDQLIEDTATLSHGVTVGFSWVSGTTYTVSVLVRAAGRNFFQIAFPGAQFSNAFANFDVSSGALGSSNAATATITSFGNGWYRCTATATAIASAFTSLGLLIQTSGTASRFGSYTGDGTSGLYIWGAQLEVGAFATSYIPTVASQVTRTADQASIVAPMFAPWYNQTEGTFVVEVDTFSPTGGFTQAVNDGTANNRIAQALGIVGTSLIVASGVTSFSQSLGSLTIGTPAKLAVAFKTNDAVSAVNGIIGAVDTSVTLPTVSRLSLGQNSVNASYLNGHIRRITYYPVRLLDTQLQALTA